MKYEVNITIRRYRLGMDNHTEFFDTLEDAKKYIEGVKRDQPHLRGYSLRKVEDK